MVFAGKRPNNLGIIPFFCEAAYIYHPATPSPRCFGETDYVRLHTELVISNGKLASCPNPPNCVSSQSADATHKIAPMTFTEKLGSKNIL